ncbi:hypothetical protein Vadar_026862 [Vaccinium darrowii]|uniref:Uncharacterized protein n=1 Tax=Vaccinium darrowii TaxID=229202 RepID=A0ACB7YQF5_9ERIC|nr:hypothetical protein Vadar_026862 [Vaccinium darrowii]
MQRTISALTYVCFYWFLRGRGSTSRAWILPKFKDPYWKEKRTNPKDYYVGLREEWNFRVEEQEGLVADLRNMGVRIPHRRSLDMPRTNKHEYEAVVTRIKEENNRMLMHKSRYFMLQLATEMAEASDRELKENEYNNALNNEKYLSDYAMSNENM